MHDYLKAIGFDIQTKKELNEIIEDIKKNYTCQTVVSRIGRPDCCELRKEYGQDIGISLCGELDENDNFELDYYFPYYSGSGITTNTGVIVNKRIEKTDYVGLCEDPRIGISLIFHLQNGIEFMRGKQKGSDAEFVMPVTFSGLALSGKILLPVGNNNEELVKTCRPSYNERELFFHAEGSENQDFILAQTINDLELYSQVSRRSQNEDLFTIVDTYFMPYGIECDLYAIMGKILAVRIRENILTKEPLYQLRVDVNELKFDICVPIREVMGEPEPGRRFKGTIWLQGKINF